MFVAISEDMRRLHESGLLKLLLRDRTTGGNIIWATDAYSRLGEEYACDKEMEARLVMTEEPVIQCRALKSGGEQNERTRSHAEVFTPLWICKKMNDYADEVWFGRSGAFEDERVVFPEKKPWTAYVTAKRLEITCGEAPFLVSRYDAATGEMIPIEKRIGLLDRKLRVVTENTDSEADWLKWARKAVESIYGYEFQGDNLLIARVNILMTYAEYLEARWHRRPTIEEYKALISVVTYNLFQMDGLTGVPPYGKAFSGKEQVELDMSWHFGLTEPETKPLPEKPLCNVYDWSREHKHPFLKMHEGDHAMKFDFIIGNPPYQEEVENNGRKNPLYNSFMDASFELADAVELITPGRFLFRAGQTPKLWNEKMLNDEHFQVLQYYSDSAEVFPNVEIKGGVAISLHNNKKVYGAIRTFTAYDELNHIMQKVSKLTEDGHYMDALVASQGIYRFSDEFFSDNPEANSHIGTGTGNKIVSSVMEHFPDIFLEQPQDSTDEYVKFIGRGRSARTTRYIKRKYLQENEYIDSYNVLVAEANNSGEFGETLSTPITIGPGVGAADTFLSVGVFTSSFETVSVVSYIRTKFFRALLGTMKVTQHMPKSVWCMIPQQDFTPASDIDWSKSIAEIDQQLYRKYGLSAEEINFIETHVKEMA